MTGIIAVAGATGYTGRRIVEQLAEHQRLQPRALIRQGSRSRMPAQALSVRFDDAAGLAAALRGCAAVIQTIGTTRAQFAPGVSYETVDYGTTVALLQAAKAAGVRRFLLLSSAGAGAPAGSYLRWKARTEQIVQTSGLDWTILRPAAIVGPGRRLIQAATWPITLLSSLPLAGGPLLRFRSITADQLARAFIVCLDRPSTVGSVLEGRALWSLLQPRFAPPHPNG